MKYLKIALFSIFLFTSQMSCNAQLCSEIDYSILTLKQLAIREGEIIIHYGIKKDNTLSFLVICPSNANEGLRIRPDKNKKGNNIILSIKYNGLTIDGPSPCRPYIYCGDASVRSYPFVKISENKLIKLSEDLNSLLKFLKEGEKPIQ